jgi:tetratricopeptide (TPR) repeat protein
MTLFVRAVTHRSKMGRQSLTRCLLLAAIISSSALIAQTNNNTGPMPAGLSRQDQSFVSPVISANELQAPHAAQSAVDQARAAFERGRFPEARRHLARALELYPNYGLALAWRGILNMREAHPDQACSDFERAIEYDPNLGAAYLSLGVSYNSLGHFDEAVVPLTRAAMLLPNAWFAHYELALAYFGSGKYDAALAAISRAAEKNPAEPDNRSSVFYTKARVLLELNDQRGAQAAFDESIRQDPKGYFAQLSQERLSLLSARVGGK